MVAKLEEPLPELMQKFCFIKFSSQAPNPNTYSYTLQCLTLTHCAPRGAYQGQGVWLFVFFSERVAREEGALKSFSFLTRQYFMTSAKGEAAVKGGGEGHAEEGSEGEACLALDFWRGGSVGRAVGRGNTLAHCRIMPLKNSFISCLLSRQNNAQQSPSRSLSLPLATSLLPGSHNTL